MARRTFATEEERKAAHRASDRAWREAHREERSAYKKAWNEAHREEISAYKKAWNEANREKCNAASKAWYEANRERCNAAHKVWLEKNKEEQKAWKKAYYNDPFWGEIKRITARDRQRMQRWSKRTGFDIAPYELHHIVYHADNDYADWPKDCLLLTPEEHETWHMEHPEWVATIA